MNGANCTQLVSQVSPQVLQNPSATQEAMTQGVQRALESYNALAPVARAYEGVADLFGNLAIWGQQCLHAALDLSNNGLKLPVPENLHEQCRRLNSTQLDASVIDQTVTFAKDHASDGNLTSALYGFFSQIGNLTHALPEFSHLYQLVIGGGNGRAVATATTAIGRLTPPPTFSPTPFWESSPPTPRPVDYVPPVGNGTHTDANDPSAVVGIILGVFFGVCLIATCAYLAWRRPATANAPATPLQNTSATSQSPDDLMRF